MKRPDYDTVLEVDWDGADAARELYVCMMLLCDVLDGLAPGEAMDYIDRWAEDCF